MELLEERLQAAYGVIRESKDMNPNCRGYALPSLCFSVLPICRTPEKTNHMYFANKAAAELRASRKSAQKLRANVEKKSLRRSTATTMTTGPTTFTRAKDPTEIPTFYFAGGITPSIREPFHGNVVTESTEFNGNLRRRRRKRDEDTGGGQMEKIFYSMTQYPPTRNTENLRRICRHECELLENELCQKEYAIAKRHPTIGQKLPLEDCHDLHYQDDCSKLGVTIHVNEHEKCYWSTGWSYRGTVAVSKSGKPCLKWARLMKEISNFPELAGQNYCR